MLQISLINFGSKLLASSCRSLQTHRTYGDIVKRRAIRVLTSEEALHAHKSGGRFSKDRTEEFTPADTGERHTLPSGVTFEKLKEFDKRLGPIVHAIENRKIRERKKIVLLEGVRLIKDAMKAGAKIKALYFTKVELLDGFPFDGKDIKVYKLKMAHMKYWSNLVTPPGVVAICETPKEADLSMSTEEMLPVTLVCDNIRDPGNMGSLLRLAAAAGCQKVIASKGCVDVWDPKVVRAGVGSHFCVPVTSNVGWQHMINYIDNNAQVFLADSALGDQPWREEFVQQQEVYTEVMDGAVQQVDSSYLNENVVKTYQHAPLHSNSLWNTDFTKKNKTVIVIGGETGPSPAAYKLAYDHHGERIHIPITTRMESLNAASAAAIILFEIRKQLTHILVS